MFSFLNAEAAIKLCRKFFFKNFFILFPFLYFKDKSSCIVYEIKAYALAGIGRNGKTERISLSGLFMKLKYFRYRQEVLRKIILQSDDNLFFQAILRRFCFTAYFGVACCHIQAESLCRTVLFIDYLPKSYIFYSAS